MPKCRICKINITNKDLKENIAIKITVDEKNIYFCNEIHCVEYFCQKKAIEKEKQQLDEIDNFVKYEIFGYDQNQKLSKVFFQRIADLRNGTTRGTNYRIKNKAKEGYSYNIILETFKEHKDTIVWCFKNKLDTANETQKINYMMAIIENNINNIYDRFKMLEIKMEKETKIEDSFQFEYVETVDKPKTTEKSNNKFSEEDLL